MTISMSNVICITNRILAGANFLNQIEKIASAGPKAIVLREKDLSETDYERLAEKVVNICRNYNVKCFLHNYPQVSITLQADGIHLPLHELRRLSCQTKDKLNVIGTSIHSAEEAVEAQNLGVDYIIAGHIFETSCKIGLAPRGLQYLQEVCASVTIPVYAIGGITPNNKRNCILVGASGVCMMSAFMTCDDPGFMI